MTTGRINQVTILSCPRGATIPYRGEEIHHHAKGSGRRACSPTHQSARDWRRDTPPRRLVGGRRSVRQHKHSLPWKGGEREADSIAPTEFSSARAAATRPQLREPAWIAASACQTEEMHA